MKITVATPSIRPAGLKIVAESLKKQTFKEWEWIICAPQKYETEIQNTIGTIVPFIFIGNSPLKDGQFWDLNYSYNQIFRKAQGELLVSYQDWIWVPPDGLEKFWVAYEETGKEAVISGVGDQYESVNKWGKPQVKIWSDPRKRLDQGSFYECYSNDAEWNWCAIPLENIRRVGGMDEGLDFLGYGGDQLQIGERMDALSIKFYLDQENESYTVRHSRDDFGGQQAWDAHHTLFSGAYDARKRELVQSGKWPILDYLS